MHAHPLETPSSSVTVFRHDELSENTCMLSTSILNHSQKVFKNNTRIFGSRAYSPTEGRCSSRVKTEETGLHSSAKKTSNKKKAVGVNSELCEFKSSLRTPRSDYPSPMPQKSVRDFNDTARLLSNINLEAPGPTLGASPMIGKAGNPRGIERKSFFEISITEEMKNWERLFNIDHDISQKIERQFEEIEGKFKNVEGEFDLCLSLNKKIEQKLLNLQTLMKGVQFTKISSKNPKKCSQRSIFYSPYHEAVCWKEIKAAFPKTNQVLLVREIVKVHANYESFIVDCNKKNLGKNQFSKQDQACFLALEGERKVLMLIAPNESIKLLFGKLISGLVRAQKKSGFSLSSSVKESIDHTAGEGNSEYESINSRYYDDIGNIKKEMSQAKQMFQANTLVLRKTFFETTQMLLKQERQNYREMRKSYRQSQEQLEKKQILLLEVTNKNLDLQKEISDRNLKNKDLILKMKHMNDDNLLTSKEISNMVDTLQRYLDSKKRKSQLEEAREDDQTEEPCFMRSDIFSEIKNFEHSFILRESSDLLQKAKEMRIMLNRLMFSHEKYLTKCASLKNTEHVQNKTAGKESGLNACSGRCEQTKKNLGKQLSLNKEMIDERRKNQLEKERVLKENTELKEKLQLYVGALEEMHSKFLEIANEIDSKQREFSEFVHFAQREVENFKNLAERHKRENEKLELVNENIEKELTKEIENKEKKVADLSHLRSDLQRSLEMLVAENKEYLARIADLEREVSDKKPEKHEETKKLELEREVETLGSKMKCLERELKEERQKGAEPKRELEEKIMTLTNLLKEQRSQIVAFQKIVGELEEKRRNAEEELASAHASISEKHSKIIFYKENLRKMKMKYESQKKSEVNHNETMEYLNQDLLDTRTQSINLIVLIALLFSPKSQRRPQDKENDFDSSNFLGSFSESSCPGEKKEDFSFKFETAYKNLSEKLLSLYKKESVAVLLESLQNLYQKLFYYEEAKSLSKSSPKISLENIEEQSENFMDISEKLPANRNINIPSPKSFYMRESLLLKAGDIVKKVTPAEKLTKSGSTNKEGRLSVAQLDASFIIESSPHQLETSGSAKGHLLENIMAHLTPKNYVRVQKPNDYSPFDSERDTRLPTTANYSNNKELINFSHNKELIHSFIDIQSQKKKGAASQAAHTLGSVRESIIKTPQAPAGDKSISEFVLGNRKKPAIFHNRALSTNMSPQITFSQFLDTIFSKK